MGMTDEERKQLAAKEVERELEFWRRVALAAPRPPIFDVINRMWEEVSK